MFDQKTKINQEKALIETDRKLLFEKLDTDKLEQSVLSLSDSFEVMESNHSYMQLQQQMETQVKQ
jgi:hypothetical protein